MEVRTWLEAITALREQSVNTIVLRMNNLIALSKLLNFDIVDFESKVKLGKAPLLRIALGKGSDTELLLGLQQALVEVHSSQTFLKIEQKWRASFSLKQ